MLKKLSLILPILPKLGYRNVAYMVWYRLSLKLGWRKRKFPLGTPVTGTFFKSSAPIKNYPESWKSKTLEKGNRILKGRLTWFHYHNFDVGSPPNWFLNPFDGSVLNNPKKHWTDLSDFDLNTGDVKILWEPSRFDWLTDLARAYRVSGEDSYLETINQWLADWSQHNPKNQGPNWKCGQETAIRVMKLIITAQLLEQETSATKTLQELVLDHLERIAGNINYAIAQDNNHGTSEAAGLYIGATWLINQENQQVSASNLHNWKKRGRALLENRLLKLIAPQGSFAQRSVNYHRVVVDTMSWVLNAMEQYNEPEFSTKITQRLEKLGAWQYKMIASDTGDAPNIGSNDGAMFETLHNCDYKDFRPSTQLFFGVLKKQRLFNKGEYDEPLFWRYPEKWDKFSTMSIPKPVMEVMDEEMLIFEESDLKCFLKLPNARYRHTTCDAFHLDVWYKGKNIFCDSGSYSYNAGKETDRFKSVEAHNTVQFGNHEQMPKISRFLYGKWLQVKATEGPLENNGRWSWKGSYTDHQNNTHRRTLEWNPENRELIITDDVSSPKNEVKRLYWHSPELEDSLFKIQVKDADGAILEPELKVTERSWYYMEKAPKQTQSFKTNSSQFLTSIQF